MATGAEILSYKGNAENAGGFTPEGARIGDDFKGINDLLSNLTQLNTRWNMDQYAQKIKDRDDTMAAIAANKIDVPVDDVYRPELEKQLQKIKQIRLATPDIKSNPKAWNDLQSEINRFQEMNAYAKTNTVELKKMVQDYANNPDSRYRQTLGSHIEDQRNKGIFHQVQPYQKMQDWTSALFGDVPEKVTTRTTVTGEGGTTGAGDGKTAVQETISNDPNKSVFTIKTLSNTPVKTKDGISMREVVTGSDLNEWNQYYSPATFLEGENKNLPDQAKVFYDFFSRDPQFMSDNSLTSINTKLDAINKANKLAPNDPRYLQPVAVKQGDGSWQLTQDPIQLVKDISLYKNYQMPIANQVVDKDMMGAYETKSKIAENYGQANQSNASAERSRFLNWLDKEKLPLEKEKLQSEIDENKRTGNVNTLQGLEAVKTVMNLVDATNKQTFYKLNDNSKVASFENGKVIEPALIRQIAGVGDNAEIRVVPLGDPAIKGMQLPELVEGKIKGVTRPSKAFMIKDGDEIKFIGLFKDVPGEAKGTSIKVFSPSNLASGFIDATTNFTVTNKDAEAKNAVFNYFGQSNQGINTSIGNSSQTNNSENSALPNQTSSSRPPGIYNIKGKNYYWDGSQLTEQ